MARTPDGALRDSIRELLVSNPKGLSIEEISTRLSISRTTTAKYLNAMEQTGQIESRPYGPAKVYSLSERVPINNIVSLLPHLILVLDDSYRVRQVNDALLDFFSLSKDDLVGRDIRFSPLGSYINEVRQEILTTALGGTPRFLEEDFTRGEETFNFYVRIIPTIFENGNKGLVLIFEDITVIKAAQSRLEELVEKRTYELEKANRRLCDEIAKHRTVRKKLELSQHEYEQLVESSTDLILKFSSGGELIYHNPLAGTILGIDDTVGSVTIHEICHGDEPANCEFAGNLVSSLLSQPDSIRKHEIEYKSADRSIWIAWTFRSIPSPATDSPAILGIGTEITERVASEKRLIDSEHHLSDILSHLPDPTFVIDNQRKVVFWNKAIEEMTGVNASDVIGKERKTFSPSIFGYSRPILADLVFDPDNEDNTKYFHNITHEEGVLTAETIGYDKNGGEIVFWVKVTPLKEQDGSIIGAIQSMRDITRMRTLEKNLIRNEELTRGMVNTSKDLIVVLDQDCRYVSVNSAYEAIFTLKNADIRGKQISDHPLPGDPELWRKILSSALQTRLSNRVEIAVQIESREFWLDCYIIPFYPYHSGSMHILLDFRDISRLKGADYTLWEDEVTLQEIGRQVSRIIPAIHLHT